MVNSIYLIVVTKYIEYNNSQFICDEKKGGW